MPRRNVQAQTEQAIPTSQQEEIVLLRGFAQLLAERTAYMFGVKALTTKMEGQSEKERKTLTAATKTVTDNLTQWIKEANITEYETALQTVKDARKALADKQKPIRDKITPLRKGMKYIDVVAVPDSIKELANVVSDPEVKKRLVVAPAFKLSEWCSNAIASRKKKD